MKIEKKIAAWGEFVSVHVALEIFKSERLTTELLFRLVDGHQVEMKNAKVSLRDIAKNLSRILPKEYLH